MFVVTIIERTPTPPEDKDVAVHTLRFDSPFAVAEFIENAALNFTCFVNVNITYIPED